MSQQGTPIVGKEIQAGICAVVVVVDEVEMFICYMADDQPQASVYGVITLPEAIQLNRVSEVTATQLPRYTLEQAGKFFGLQPLTS